MPRVPKPTIPAWKKSRQIVLSLRLEKGLSYGEIAKETGVSKGRAHEWVKAYESTGQVSAYQAGRPVGARSTVTDRMINLVKVFMKGKERRGTRPCVEYLKSRHGLEVHRSTVQAILKNDLGLYPYRKQTRPKLTDAHKQHRIQVAEEFLGFSAAQGDPNPWENVAFSDECRFHSEPRPNARNDVIWDDSPDDEKHFTERSKYAGQSCEVWGAISRFGKTKLIFIERPVVLVDGESRRRPFRSADYINTILEPAIPELRAIFEANGVADDEWCFQQDGDAKHKSTLVQNWLKDNVANFMPKEDWPANSPDLNPIENCWSMMIWES